MRTLFWTAGALIASAVVATGCTQYRGAAVAADPGRVARDPAWTILSGVPLINQEQRQDCGPAAVGSVLAYWGKPTRVRDIDRALHVTRSRGATAGELERYVRERGLCAFVLSGTMHDVTHEIDSGRPVLVGVLQPYTNDRVVAHFQVVTGYSRKARQVLVMDPARGWSREPMAALSAEWGPGGRVMMVVLGASPSECGGSVASELDP